LNATALICGLFGPPPRIKVYELFPRLVTMLASKKKKYYARKFNSINSK
jgi:hypothetical protein